MNKVIRRIEGMMLILIFGLTIYTPFIVGLIQEDETVSIAEKRSLAKWPPIPGSLKDLNDYTKQFDSYYSDHFGLRERLTEEYFSIRRMLGQGTGVDHVTLGQGGWLFLGSIEPGYEAYNDPIGDAINANLYSQKDLAAFANSITATQNWLAEKGIEYIYIIAPNKHTIYFEKLPEFLKKQGHISATDQLVSYLNENTDV